MRYPLLQEVGKQRLYTMQFNGIERRPGAADGTLYNTENVEAWANSLQTRKERRLVAQHENAQGMTALEGIAWIDGGKLYYKGEDTGIRVTEGEKEMITFGAYIVVLPDGAYYNTADPTDKGNMDRLWESKGAVTYQVCRMDGTVYDAGEVIASDTEPAEKTDGLLWINTSLEVHAMYRWSAGYQEWQDVLTVYLRFGAQGIGVGLKENDAIDLSGCAYDGEGAMREQINDLNGSVIVKAAGDDYIVIVGIIDRMYTQRSGKVRADRKRPKMDYVINCQNRLWGCFRGESEDGQQLNEIYATALGDLRNWTRYGSTADSSYAISVGSEGPWTGAVVCNNYPYFFKESCYYRIYGTKPSDFQSQQVICDGVKEGCSRSAVVVKGNILYLSRQGVMMLDTQPTCVSEALGRGKWSNAAAIGNGDDYWISMQDEQGNDHLYVLDTGTGRWMRQDGLKARCFARQGDSLLALTGDGRILDLLGEAGESAERSVKWEIETNDFGYELPDAKYLSRFNIRIFMGRGAKADLWLKYDDEPVWVLKGHLISKEGTRSYNVPVVPKRCDRVRVKLTGEGLITLYSIDRMMTYGSDAAREEGGTYHG